MTRRVTRNPVHRCAYGVLLGLWIELVMLVEALVDAVAHLCKAGVRGSIPLVSTSGNRSGC